MELQNVSKAPLIERIKSLAGLHRHIPIYLEPIIWTTAQDTDLVSMKHLYEMATWESYGHVTYDDT